MRTAITTAFCTTVAVATVDGTYARRVLIRLATLERIVGGEIDTQFRRQKKPTVKAGGTLRTHVGMLEIVDVAADRARRRDRRRMPGAAGAADREEVIAELTKQSRRRLLSSATPVRRR